MSRLKELLRVATPSTRNLQQDPVQVCSGVAQQTQATQHKDASTLSQIAINDFEALLAVVGPVYNTPAHEYAEICEVAKHDLAAALQCYRTLAG